MSVRRKCTHVSTGKNKHLLVCTPGNGSYPQQRKNFRLLGSSYFSFKPRRQNNNGPGQVQSAEETDAAMDCCSYSCGGSVHFLSSNQPTTVFAFSCSAMNISSTGQHFIPIRVSPSNSVTYQFYPMSVFGSSSHARACRLEFRQVLQLKTDKTAHPFPQLNSSSPGSSASLRTRCFPSCVSVNPARRSGTSV